MGNVKFGRLLVCAGVGVQLVLAALLAASFLMSHDASAAPPASAVAVVADVPPPPPPPPPPAGPAPTGSIGMSKAADPGSVQEPGGDVTFSFTVTNTSDVDVTVTDVVDSVFGDIDDEGGNGCFDVPINLGPGEHASCHFTDTVSGAGGSSHVNTVTAFGHDEHGHELSASAQARVDITERLIDLALTKTATSPTPLNGTVTYSLTVTNKGPDTATNVEVADPAPVGISYVGATPDQGTCTVTPSLVTCSLGTLAAGQSVSIGITGKATSVGSIVNTATVTGSGGRETNATDNVVEATTEVPTPLAPPTQPRKPTAKSHTASCLTMTVSPKMVKADRHSHRIMISVTAAGAPVRNAKIVVQGAGIRQSGRSNSSGVIVFVVRPSQAGVITITAQERQRESCGAKRVAVTGVFVPPVTG